MTSASPTQFTPIHKLTDRLELREWKADDSGYADMYQLESLPEVVRYQDWTPRDQKTCIQVVDAIVESQAKQPRSHIELAVFLREGDSQQEGGFLGRVGSNVDYNTDPVRADLWFAFIPSFQGKGYATEAVDALIEVLTERGVRKLDIECDPRNVGSRRLAERLGFTKVKEIEKAWESKGEWVGSLEYSKLLE